MEEQQPQLPMIRAAQYVRMSTEHQKYSTDNQATVIKEYAAKHGMDIIHTYADEGKSGLNIEGRKSLQQMIDDVTAGRADYEVILVYDISRWGRFQDADQSAYYEYVIKQHKIRVEYCAEMFENDGSTTSTIIKAVKRTMAGEYSRELSKKVFLGQCNLIQLGYRQGGMAGFGLRRMLVDSHGHPQRVLKMGERKSLQTERVILVPGPEEEVETVKWIYDQFITHNLKESEIAHELNARGVLTEIAREMMEQELEGEHPRRWNRGLVHEILTNEKYIGNNVFNRRSFKLKEERVANPPDMWVRAEEVFDPIVDKELFYTVRGIIQERNRRYSNEEMLDLLKQLYQKKGYLSGIVIDEQEHLPSSGVYASRFGSLIRAYKLVGYTPERDYAYLEINKFLRQMHPKQVQEIIHTITELGGAVEKDEKNDLLTINQELTVSLVIARCQTLPSGKNRWHARFDTGLRPDITIVARMDPLNKKIQDFYLIPSCEVQSKRVRLSQENDLFWDAYRFDDLDFFFNMARRATITVRAA
uniref:Recombinase n=1 Tax=Magnetococcus massalia (strain MO-1) TaxID=451514 RepID=A0A1S7LIR8_MAGMO|nr:Recombinase [Candidatus Magnetococcus massalia]CRH05999.1 Recombinase [Candidatus Magnetococcus massalia]